MKTCWSLLLFIFLSAQTLYAQDTEPADSTGLPGDNFSLEGALDLFKQSDSPEDFEKRLNAPDNDVNNLDLNEDGKVDYVRVMDQMDGEVHAIVLQVPVNGDESQDVAVIELEKTGAESAILQIIGDEDIYGKQVIAEPYEEEVKKNGRNGPSPTLAPVRIVVNVWLWPAVRYVYRPAYVAYVSPWRWGLYPTWWRPFRPHPWRAFHVRVRPHRVHYHVVSTHRVVHAHKIYAPRRTHSTVVHTRTVTHVSKGGKHGGTHVTKTKTTRVKGPQGGAVKQKKTTTGRGRGRKH